MKVRAENIKSVIVTFSDVTEVCEVITMLEKIRDGILTSAERRENDGSICFLI